MTKTKPLRWRLKDLPTPDEIGKLVDLKIITTEQARSIFFSEEETPKKPEASELDSVKAEIKMLRELVMALASRPTEIVRIVKQYDPYPWHKPYLMWATASAPTTGVSTTAGANSTLGLGSGKFNNIMLCSSSVSPDLSIGSTYRKSDIH